MPPGYRRCLTCRRTAPREEFWRVVRVYPSREIQLDFGMGRSCYLCPTADCLQGARQKNRLARALKAPAPESVYQTLAARLPQIDPP